MLGVVRFTGEDAPTIDLVVGRSEWQRAAIARATHAHVFALNLPIVTIEDLIVLKLYAGGVQDRWDIEQLLTSAASSLSVGDIDLRAQSLPERSQTLWRTLRPA